MQGKSRTRVIALVLALLAGGGAWAEGDDKTFEGTVEILWRNVNVDGNQDKYNEDYQGLSSGGRLGNLWLNFVNDGDSPIDYAQVQAQGLGGDPTEFANIRVGSSSNWDLRYNRRKQDHIYNLFDYMDDLDGHSWETQRQIDEVDLKFYPSKNFDVLAGFRQNQRSGNSLFMKDVSRDLFLMNTPVDTTRRDLYIGLNSRIGDSVDILFRQTHRRYKNDFVNTTMGDLGLDQAGPTVLNDYVWNQQELSKADLTQLNVHYGSRLVDVNVGYYGTLFGEEEFDTVVLTDQQGVEFDGAPRDLQGASATTTERDLQYFEADVGLYVTRFLNLVFQYDTLQWDQSSTGVINLEPGLGPIDTRWDYSIDTGTVYAEVVPTRRLNIQIGGRTIDRELEREGFDVLGGERDGLYESKGDETVIAAIAWRSELFHIAADYEDGSVDTPFAQVSPFDTERLRFRFAVMPRPGMKVEATYLDYENDNTFDLARANNAQGELTSLSFSNNAKHWNYFLRYSRQDVDTVALVNFDLGGPQDGVSTFATDNEQFRTMIRYDSSRWSAFLRVWLAQSEGSSDLVANGPGPVPNAALTIDQEFFDGEIGLNYTLPTGIWVGAAYRVFEYEDPGQLLRVSNDLDRSLDYDGNIVTLRAGYIFGRPKR